MIYIHTIGRIGKDCNVITGTYGTFMVVDIALDDYCKGKNITTWVRVKSSKENHIRLVEHLTKGRMVLVEGTLTSVIWIDRNGENHIQHSIIADSIAFVNIAERTRLTIRLHRHVRLSLSKVTLLNYLPMHRRTMVKTCPSEVVLKIVSTNKSITLRHRL